MAYEHFSREELIDEIERLKRLLRDLEDSRDSRLQAMELENRAMFLQTLIDAIPGPIFYKDAKGVYIGCNSAFEKMIGRSREEVIGKSVYEIAPKDLASQYHAMDSSLLKDKGTQVYDFVARQNDGTLRDYTFFKSSFSNADGETAGIVGVMLDITDKKKAEEELNVTQRELEARVRQRTRQLASANEELRNEIAERVKAEEALVQSAEKQKIFAYSIVHDLKSPTVAIHGLAKNMKRRYEHLLDEKGVNYLDQILKASELVAVMVEKINIYIAAKESPLNIENVNLLEVIDIVREEFSTALSLKQVNWLEPENKVQIRADRLALLRVFRNFVDNALKYGGDKLSVIRINHMEDESFHYIMVSDDGVGLRAEDSEKIMGLFQRTNATPDIPGTGLGLAIVREIAERHLGALWVETGPDCETTFYISISKEI